MHRSLFLFFLLVLILSLTIGSATSSLPLDGGAIQIFEYTVSIPTLTPTATPTPTCTSTSTPTSIQVEIIVQLSDRTGRPIRTNAPAPTAPPPPIETTPIVVTQVPPEIPTETLTPGWDGSSLEFTGQGSSCDEGGMLWAELTNRGEDMTAPTTWELYSGDILVTSSSLSPIPSGGTYTLRERISQAGTYQYKVYQPPVYPGPGELWSKEIVFAPGDCVTPVEEPAATPTLTPPPTPTESPTETQQSLISDTPTESSSSPP